MARLAELDSEGNTLGIGTVPPSAVLRQGSAGQDVITLDPVQISLDCLHIQPSAASPQRRPRIG